MIIAACGNNCAACPRYTEHPFEKTDDKLRHTAELWMKIGYRDHIVTNEEIACNGCKIENWCRYRVIKCCVERGIETCAECGEYPCDNMKECFEVTKSFEPACRRVCTDEEYAQLKKAFFEKEKNLAARNPASGNPDVGNAAAGQARKKIKVVAALIRRDDLLFATQRGYGNYKDWWEFPGGKIEPGESPQEALVREIREELGATIAVDDFLMTVEYDYPEFHLTMDCFWCHVEEGHLTLLEHEASRWLPACDLRQVNWLPADLMVIEGIEKQGNASN